MKITIIIASLIAVSAARAQTFEEAAACVHDAFHFCKHEARSVNMSAIRQCLISNRDKISRKCRDTLRAHGA